MPACMKNESFLKQVICCCNWIWGPRMNKSAARSLGPGICILKFSPKTISTFKVGFSEAQFAKFRVIRQQIISIAAFKVVGQAISSKIWLLQTICWKGNEPEWILILRTTIFRYSYGLTVVTGCFTWRRMGSVRSEILSLKPSPMKGLIIVGNSALPSIPSFFPTHQFSTVVPGYFWSTPVWYPLAA